MIEFVSGRLRGRKPAEAIVEVNGVAFKVLIPTSTFNRLPPPDAEVKLLTYLHVREDALQLFGFSTLAERTLFVLMIRASGIGPKLALAALSAMNPAHLCEHIRSGDSQMLTRIPGIGRKTADRLVIELRDRIDEVIVDDAVPSPSAQARSDALAALETLGFTRVAAERRLRGVQRAHPEVNAADALIRLALQV